MGGMTVEALVWTLCCSLTGLIVVIIGWGMTRIFKQLDEIATKFETISKTLSDNMQKIYIDIHQADDKIWETVGRLDKRVVVLEATCKHKCRLSAEDH